MLPFTTAYGSSHSLKVKPYIFVPDAKFVINYENIWFDPKIALGNLSSQELFSTA
mgnify:FL=1